MPKKQTQSIQKVISLNSEQRAVVGARTGYFACLAGPGSGKSRCVVERYVALLREGVSPNDIVSLSFTSTAAKNLRDRVEAQVGKLSISRTAGSMTFHGMALAFSQQERDAFPFALAEFPLATEPVAYKLAAEAGRRFEIDARQLRPAISLWKRSRISPAQAIKEAEAKGNAKLVNQALAYKSYDQKCRENGVLDFDGLIYQMVEILSKNPEVRQRWKFDWLQLDEAQDCSQSEWDLARLISGKSVLAVGDISQGIYGFRASDSKLFREMDKIFPGTQTLFLAANYRSTPEIIQFIKPHATCQELAEKFWTPNSSGPAPRIVGFKSPMEEANWVVSQIKEAL